MDRQPNHELILHLDDVQVATVDDGNIRIACVGTVASAGWGAAELRPQQLFGDESTLALDFVAAPPENPAAQMIKEIRAEYVIRKLDGLQNVSVRSRTNAITVSLVPE